MAGEEEFPRDDPDERENPHGQESEDGRETACSHRRRSGNRAPRNVPAV
jgi:hypothetical protein